jgi:hypothetical protein
MTVIKRSQKSSSADLITAVEKLIPYLKGQNEDEACVDLEKAADVLSKHETGSPEHKAAIDIIIDAFDGDHELGPYAMPRDSKGKWTDIEELSVAAARVINLARRLKK